MPFDIQFSEHGTLADIVRGVQMLLALDAIDAVTVRFDFDSGPWRHFFSGAQQVHLRRLTRDIRSPHMQARFRDADIKQIALCSARVIAQDAPAQTWLLTTGGAMTAASEDVDRYLGHIQVCAARGPGAHATSPLRIPVGICTQTFGPRRVADAGVLVVGCGDAQADCTMLALLAACTNAPLTLFDVYIQHAGRKPEVPVRVVEVQDPAGRAALYASCQCVVSGSLQCNIDDHFVEEAAHVGCAVLQAPHAAESDDSVWTAETVSASFQHAKRAGRTSALSSDAPIAIEDQASRVAQMILQPARQPPWSIERLHQYCDVQSVVPGASQVAWVHCGREAMWDDACVRWLSQSKYQTIYVDTSQTALVFSCLFAALLSQQLAHPGRVVPRVQGGEYSESLRALVAAQLRQSPASSCDVVHLSCSLPSVLSTRRDLHALQASLACANETAPSEVDIGVRPMVFANIAKPVDAGALTAKVVGASDAIEQVLRGLMYDVSGRLRMCWLRRSGARTHHGRIYFYPFEHNVLVDHDELALAQVREGLQTGRIDVLVAAAASSTVGLMEAREAWAIKPTPIVTLLQALPAPRARLDTVSQIMLRQGLASDLCVAPSTAVRDAFQKHLGAASDELFAATDRRFSLQGEIEVIPYGVDVSAFCGMHKSTCRQLLRLPPDRTVLLCVGRFNRHEASDLLPLLIALQDVVQAAHRPLLVLAGHDYDYKYSAEVREHVARLGLEDFVDIRKNIQANQKSYLYGASDVLLSVEDTVYHTFCNTVIEAMAAGLPVIASAWGSHREVVMPQETGLLVPTQWTQVPADLDIQAALSEPPPAAHYRDIHESIAVDVQALARAMSQLCESQTQRLRMGEAGRRRVLAHYDIRQQSRRLSNAILSRVAQARADGPKPPTAKRASSQDGLFSQFGGFASHVLENDTVIALTERARDNVGLTTLLAAVDVGDNFESRKLQRLVEVLAEGPRALSDLNEPAIDMRRVMRALKYGLVQVAK